MPRRRQKSLADQARALAPFLSSADIARLFGISDRTVYREAQRGWMALPAPLPCPKNSVYKWLREDVVRWLENPDARRVVASSKPGPRIVPAPRTRAS